MCVSRPVALASALLLAGAGCAPVVPYHPPPHTGHAPTTMRGDGHGSTMPSADLTRAGGMYPGAAGRVRDHQEHGLDPDAGGQYGGAGYGTGAYGPPR
ncbi:MAG: hypothetical protein K2X91_16875 [Thermoleophilia bacterium]|nr:hypothetical protein [Acetobacteraceae bacterium]MBY0398120.1 hypothetical protein [Thermoleophilia bacterium]